MSNKGAGFILGAVIFCGTPQLAWSRGGAGATSAEVLTTQVSARAAGMGGAFSAVSDDVNAIHTNPAGLALLTNRQLSTMFLKEVLDIRTEYLAFGAPVPDFLNKHLAIGGNSAAYGVSALFSQLGTLELIETNPDGTFAREKSLNVGSDAVLSASYASMFESDSTVLDINQQHAFGGSVRYVSSTRAEQYTAQTVAVDIGYLNVWKNTGLRWSLIGQNLGPDIKYKEAKEPLPLTVTAGGAWRKNLPYIGAEPFILAVDGTYDRERKKSARMGVEYWMKGMAAARAGYHLNGVSNAFSVGAGLKLPGLPLGKGSSILFDYGVTFEKNVGTKNIVSFSMAF